MAMTYFHELWYSRIVSIIQYFFMLRTATYEIPHFSQYIKGHSIEFCTRENYDLAGLLFSASASLKIASKNNPALGSDPWLLFRFIFISSNSFWEKYKYLIKCWLKLTLPSILLFACHSYFLDHQFFGWYLFESE